MKPHPYKIECDALPVVRTICANIAVAAGYDVNHNESRDLLHVYAYKKESGEWISVRVYVRLMYAGEMKITPSGVRISFFQRYKAYYQPKKWMKAKLFIDDEYGNHHWYVDPQKFIETLEVAIEYMKELGI